MWRTYCVSGNCPPCFFSIFKQLCGTNSLRSHTQGHRASEVWPEPLFAPSLSLSTPRILEVCGYSEKTSVAPHPCPSPFASVLICLLGLWLMQATVASMGQLGTTADSLPAQESPVTIDKWSVSFSHIVLIAGLRPELSR